MAELTPIQRFTVMSEDMILNFGEKWWIEKNRLLFNTFGWVPPEDWKRVVAWINRTCDNRLPKVGRFWTALEVLQIVKDYGNGTMCHGCEGLGGRVVFLRRKRLDVRHSTFEPCMLCVVPAIKEKIGEMEFASRKDWFNEEFVEITEEEYHAPRTPYNG